MNNRNSIVGRISSIFKGTTPNIAEQNNKSISTLEEVMIGGLNQYICIRGKNINNPIFLFLHGGPGDSILPVMTGINKDLEDDLWSSDSLEINYEYTQV